MLAAHIDFRITSVVLIMPEMSSHPRLSIAFVSTYTRTWIFGTSACKLLSAMKGINGYASVLTMAMMSVDRFWAVVYPLRSIRFRTVRNAVVVCVIVWAVCLIIMLPYWLYAEVRVSAGNSSRRHKCEISWPAQSQREHLRFWANFELIVGFIIPVVVVATCYVSLLVGLSHHRRDANSGHDHGSEAISQRSDALAGSGQRRPMRKVTVMVVTVTTVFIACWTPYHVINYHGSLKAAANAGLFIATAGTPWATGKRCDDSNPLRTISTPRPENSEILRHIIMNAIAQGLIFVSSCCNPFIYCISSQKFRMYERAIIVTPPP